MATVNFTRYEFFGAGMIALEWANMGAGDVGQAFIATGLGHGHADRSVQLVGTTSGATMTFEGSNQPNLAPVNSDYFTLTDPTQTALVFAAVGGKEVLEATLLSRPRITGGDGSTALTVWLFVVRAT